MCHYRLPYLAAARAAAYEGFTAEEEAAMKEQAAEQDVLAKIAEMPEDDRQATMKELGR